MWVRVILLMAFLRPMLQLWTKNPLVGSRISKSFGPDFIAYAIESESQIFKEAMSTLEAQMWKEIINSEIESILNNHT